MAVRGDDEVTTQTFLCAVGWGSDNCTGVQVSLSTMHCLYNSVRILGSIEDLCTVTKIAII